jgi:sigma-B regulation protein RsbU (phosphoserine phosphatase)
VRQELSSPATAIMGYAEILMDDAVQAGRVQLTDDLQRILDASRTLHRLILSLLDPATIHRTDGNADLAELRRTLRHDLRTPINAIKGYGEMLREDAAAGSAETFVADLDKLLGEATLLLARIDGLVTYSGGDAPPSEEAARTATEIAAPASMVESLLKAVRPVAANEAGLAAVRPSRILVVDDNASNRDLLSRRLQRQGHTVLQAEDGARALALVEKEALDLVLLDLMMPGISGYDVLALLKRDSRFRDIPVIMISALSELDSIVRCIEAGADDYLAKPFDPTLLRARVGASLEKKRLRDELRASLARLEEELDQARKMQLGMLPRHFPACTPEHPVEVHASMEPAREVGGDLYDCFYANMHLFCFLVGDVSGKGAPAAMFMARTRSLVRVVVDLWQRADAAAMSSAQIAEAVNRELCQDNDDCMFVTLFLGLLDTRTGTLAYTNAGHPAPHILRASGDIEQIEGKPDVPLGVRSKATYRTDTIALLPGDAVVVVSDGVDEAMNSEGDFYTLERLDAVLRGAGKASAAELVRAVTDHVRDFVGSAPKADDVTALGIRWLPTTQADASTAQRFAEPVSASPSCASSRA